MILRTVTIFCAVIFLFATSATANEFGNLGISNRDLQLAREAYRYSKSEDWQNARETAQQASDPRIRVLQNGLNTIDAAGTCVDHAVSFHVSNVTSLEVVRGPATLLYGSNAIGGVVNAVDNRIPDERLDGLHGNLGGRYSSADNGYGGNVMVEGGEGPWAFHFEGFSRMAEDLAIPGNALSDRYRQQTGDPGTEGRLPGSNLRSEGFSGGLSYIEEWGFIGASLTTFHTNYASPAEEGISIDMQQLRLDVRGAFYEPLPLIKEINYRFAWSDYEHTEFEGVEKGTVFENMGWDGRIYFFKS